MSRARPMSSSFSTPAHESTKLTWSPRVVGTERKPTGDAPVEYIVEERRRTFYVKSSVPPDQWDETTLQSFVASPVEQGETSAAPFRRAQSCTLASTKIEEVDEESDTTSVSSGGTDSSYQTPASEMPPAKPTRPESYPSTPTKLRKPPPSPPAVSRGFLGAQARRKIYFYHRKDPHYGFTNFSPHLIIYKGKEYPTSEHLFQSFKFQEHRPLLAEHIRTFSDRPSVALSEARRFQPEARRDWMQVNVAKMDETLWHKFNQHPDLKRELLDTGNAELIEDSDKDSFWGVGADRKGRNELGKALERLRSRLRTGEQY